MKEISESTLRKIEWGVAIIMTMLVVTLHLIFMRHAGGLWRDEAGGVDLAEMPSLSELLSHISHDSFPILWWLVLRLWWCLGLGSDFGFRVLGFFTGLLCVGAVWFTARSFKLKFPMFSLLLLAANPLLVIYGDSMRAYGCGVLWIVLECGLIWRVVEFPTRWRVVSAVLVAIAAVQTTYTNSALLLVLCSAGCLVAVRRRLWRRAMLILGVGAVAGLTMLPYLKVFQMGADHFSIQRQPYLLGDFLEKLLGTISGRTEFTHEILDMRVWWVLLIVAAPLLVVCQFLPERTKVTNLQKDLLLYGVATICLALPAYFIFLHELKFVTNPWYYLPVIVMGALALEAVFSVAENWEQGRLFRLLTVLMIGYAVFPQTFGLMKRRMTNIDLIAEHLNHVATTNDLIVVDPSFCSPSFARDYAGAAPWISLPVMEKRMQRYDILKELLVQPDRKQVVVEVVSNVRKTLESGGRVWGVSLFGFGIGQISSEPTPPSYSASPDLMKTVGIVNYWSDAVAYYLQEHSQRHELVPIQAADEIGKYENMKLIMVSGWRSGNSISPATSPELSSRSH